MPPKRKRSPGSIPPIRFSKRLRGKSPSPPPAVTAPKKAPTNVSPESLPTATDPAIDPDIPEIIRSQPYSGPKSSRTQLALSLPPLYKLDDIYKSITARAIELGFDEFISYLSSRPLRVVTVCSGTESPLLALEMVKENLQEHFNREFNFFHLFSAEIVPFKQAYIERNFHPKLIFRDVAELKDRVAQTAYGSLEKIPKNPDILIAGFSCVDFSGLNNKRKTLDERGESGGTFWGIIRYAKTYRPPLVILENVKTAPWDKIEQHWAEIDYFAIHVDVDTKAYYLPQTRERGYMFCVDRKRMNENSLAEADMLNWLEIFAQFKRPASSAAGLFLMDLDDPRLEQIEKDMAIRISSSSSRTAVNWSRYQVRHQNYRLNQGLGYRRPISKSQDDGTCEMPDFAWQTWVKSLPERVWDTLDVNFLRKLVEGYDMNYKERCIELSQGVEREIDSRAYGIVGCITPCGIPYVTTRGGPLCGLESLALQGLPLDRLLLTQESQRELQDLAGNAMSSTVVGAAVLSALIVGHRVLGKKTPSPITPPRTPRQKSTIPREENKLVLSNMKEPAIDVDIRELQRLAIRSARYCMCERQTSIRAPIIRCTLCKHTACLECGGNPPHAYEGWNDLERSAPLDFVSDLRNILPSRLIISGISEDDYSDWKQDPYFNCLPTIWNDFLTAVTRAVGDELRFLDIKRSEVWTVSYEGRFSILKFIIGAEITQWLFFAKASDDKPTLCLIREILSKPIARMAPRFGLFLEGEWEVCAPISSRCTLGISGGGNQIQSYGARCGLEIPEFSKSKVWSHITIQGPDKEVRGLDTDIRGTYDLLPDCGTANGCLHRKLATDAKPSVYLFLDPTKLGEPRDDAFVLSLEHRRNSGYTVRMAIAEVSHKWRSWNACTKLEPTTIYYRKWTRAQTASLIPYSADAPLQYYNLDPDASISISNVGCHGTNITLLSLSAPENALGSASTIDTWDANNPVDSPDLMRDYSWALQKAAGISAFREWERISNGQGSVVGHPVCPICVPPKPRILWGRNSRGWIQAYENLHDAAVYERQVKSRPPPFLIFRRIDKQGRGNLRVTLNIQTLLHQAYHSLISPNNAGAVTYLWRLVPNSCEATTMAFHEFQLVSNRNNPPSSQPPGFLLKLRPEQLRSLSWMVQQEGNVVEPFVEEENEEAILPSLMWRAEGRVVMQKTIRGGILADDVGYGKTAIVLGLIDELNEKARLNKQDPVTGFIPTRATLIVVPHIMVKQWQSEIAKFLGDKYKVLVFQSAVALAKKAIRDIQNCDIILVSWSVFNTSGYYKRMQRFTGTPRVPDKAGRHFDDWFRAAQSSLKDQVQILMDQGPNTFLESLQIKRQNVRESREHYNYVPSKRLRGKQYEQANLYKELGDADYAEISSADEVSDADDEKDPDILRERVDRLLKLVPTKWPDDDLDQVSETDSMIADNDYDDFTSEANLPRVNGSHPQHAGAKKGLPSKNRLTSSWDDRKEFNISKDSKDQDWQAVRAPLFHAFMFNRIVIDEFTYANPERLGPLHALQARSKWVLSGTPPLNDFADVKTIASFIGVHLGIDDEKVQGHSKRLRIITKQRSEAEIFQSFQAPRSEAWHNRRDEVAQRFLDRFARRNIAEIDEIPFSERIILVRQSPAEKAIYLELYKQLMTYNRQLRRNNRGRLSGDQAERLDEIIISSSTAEEALLKRCTSLALQGRWENGKPEGATCESLIRVREEQLANLRDDLTKKLKLAAWVYCSCDVDHENFHKFIESIVKHDFGDMTVTEKVYPLLKSAILASRSNDWKLFFVDPSVATVVPNEVDDSDQEIQQIGDKESTKRGKSSRKEQKPAASASLPHKPTRVREFEPILREVTTALRNLIVEWVLRERALRFLKTVRQVQTTCSRISSSRNTLQCHNCQSIPESLNDINVLGSCGHALCSNCISGMDQSEECPVERCRGSGKRFNIINASTLGNDEEDISSEYGGSKMDTLVQIILSIPNEEQALVFVQFPDLMEVVSKAFSLAHIKHTTISPTDRKSGQKVERFQKTSFGEDRVLVLHLGGEMAAGLNLQCANHVIFLSPLLTHTQYDYDSTMTQAIGRSRRYGQTRQVHVYHLLAKMTIDVNIFQDRLGGKVLIDKDGEAILVSPNEATESDAISCQGPSLVVDNAF